jgi:hypothetical protein
MKKIYLYLLFTLFFIACGNGNSPKGVAFTFLTHVKSENYQEAKKYGTESTAKMLNLSIGMSTNKKDRAKSKGFKILRETITGDEATVVYFDEDMQKEEAILMTKIDGLWKVNLKMGK